jgi:hypothetical protein
MKLQDLKVVYICPDHDDKYKARKVHMEALLTRIGFLPEKVEHFKSSTENYPDCLGKAVIEILTKYMNEPVLILEDDVEFTGIDEFDMIKEADAIYFGLSIAGGHATQNHADGPCRHIPFSESQVRIQNMLATHAILYISPSYKQAVIESFQAHIGQRYHTDVLMSRLHPKCLVLANKRPSFYQSARFNTGSEEYYTKITFT